MVTKADINLNLALVSLTEIDIILEIVHRNHIPQLAIVFVKVKVYFWGVQTSAKLKKTRGSVSYPQSVWGAFILW